MMEFESRNEFWKVVPPNGSMVEIGVFDGDFSMKNINNFKEKFAQKDYPTYYAVDKDIQMWRQKLKLGGLLSGHDFCVNKKERKLEKYKSIAPWCGIYKSESAVMSDGADSGSAK